MMRQISVTAPSTPPREAASGDLGDWLGRDLRMKGAPISSRPAPPSAEERERAQLVDWLARDLTPKHSVRPSQLPPEPDAAAAPTPPASVVAAGALLPPAQDSLVPQVLPPAVVLGEERSAPDLDDDDLSVLPGRRRKAASRSRRQRAALALAVLLVVGGAGLLFRGGGAAANFEAAANAAATDTAVALPPPPPAEVAEPLASELPPSTTGGHGARAGETSPEPPGLVDPRSFLGGLAVRRYADVPSPTLSRLAREQRARARARDDAVRAANAEAGSPPEAKPGAAAK